MYYLDDRVSLTGLVAGQRLGYPSLQKLLSVISVESFFSTLGYASCNAGSIVMSLF